MFKSRSDIAMQKHLKKSKGKKRNLKTTKQDGALQQHEAEEMLTAIVEKVARKRGGKCMMKKKKQRHRDGADGISTKLDTWLSNVTMTQGHVSDLFSVPKVKKVKEDREKYKGTKQARSQVQSSDSGTNCDMVEESTHEKKKTKDKLKKKKGLKKAKEKVEDEKLILKDFQLETITDLQIKSKKKKKKKSKDKNRVKAKTERITSSTAVTEEGTGQGKRKRKHDSISECDYGKANTCALSHDEPVKKKKKKKSKDKDKPKDRKESVILGAAVIGEKAKKAKRKRKQDGSSRCNDSTVAADILCHNEPVKKKKKGKRSRGSKTGDDNESGAISSGMVDSISGTASKKPQKSKQKRKHKSVETHDVCDTTEKEVDEVSVSKLPKKKKKKRHRQKDEINDASTPNQGEPASASVTLKKKHTKVKNSGQSKETVTRESSRATRNSPKVKDQAKKEKKKKSKRKGKDDESTEKHALTVTEIDNASRQKNKEVKDQTKSDKRRKSKRKGKDSESTEKHTLVVTEIANASCQKNKVKEAKTKRKKKKKECGTETDDFGEGSCETLLGSKENVSPEVDDEEATKRKKKKQKKKKDQEKNDSVESRESVDSLITGTHRVGHQLDKNTRKDKKSNQRKHPEVITGCQVIIEQLPDSLLPPKEKKKKKGKKAADSGKTDGEVTKVKKNKRDTTHILRETVIDTTPSTVDQGGMAVTKKGKENRSKRKRSQDSTKDDGKGADDVSPSKRKRKGKHTKDSENKADEDPTQLTEKAAVEKNEKRKRKNTPECTERYEGSDSKGNLSITDDTQVQANVTGSPGEGTVPENTISVKSESAGVEGDTKTDLDTGLINTPGERSTRVEETQSNTGTGVVDVHCVQCKVEQQSDHDQNENNTNQSTPSMTNAACMGQWRTANFQGSAQKDKFFRLLGMRKKQLNADAGSEERRSSYALNDSQARSLNQQLENQYCQAMSMKWDIRRGFGLGYSEPAKTQSKKFHIDKDAVRSVKFED
ncbi:micronuclear linker histone polyprotein-like [Ptychodera flava]|uniref:micronuclear linker histone polyprotein-like n=1 Tax=Ptychodera flava TaxID=63121 RepID=UPI00396A7D99